MAENLFSFAISKIFEGWAALQLAVQHQAGGRDSQAKAAWLVQATGQWMSDNVNLYPDEVEEFLDSIMDTEFETRVEDGSSQEMAERLCTCCRLYTAGDVEGIQRVISQLPSAASVRVHRTEGMEDDDSSSDEDCDLPTANIASRMSAMDCQDDSESPAQLGDNQDTSGASGAQSTSGNLGAEGKGSDTDDGFVVVQRKKGKRR